MAFWITALIYIPGALLFAYFGTDKIQEWAKDEKRDVEEEEGKNNSTYEVKT